ncbi:MAG: hypothetical protein QG657_3740 [Acidobacteriota bacterium]|nr:hypothetical protein [Acidobacteriota bacterium]
MDKKIVSIVTLIAFAIFAWDCSVKSVKPVAVETVQKKGAEKINIVGLLNKTGEKIEFDEANPVQIKDNAITGETISPDGDKKSVSIPLSEVSMFLVKQVDGEKVLLPLEAVQKKTVGNFNIVGVLKKTGEKIEFARKNPVLIINDAIIGETVPWKGDRKSVSIPLSEVSMVLVKKVDKGKSFLATLGVALGAIGLVTVIAFATKKSCPFIYSFDGRKYIFDAEPYGGAICPALKRMEWIPLRHIQEVNGKYRILVANEVDETQYTDELKLVIVDHPANTQVVPDLFGDIHTITNPITPSRAYDKKGNNLALFVGENDWVSWQSREEARNPDTREDLKDELIFEFPKPKDAPRAKLIFNGCNTQWGSYIIQKYLDLYGEKVSDWYNEMNNLGPAFFNMKKILLDEELYSLQINVETETGWQSKGMLLGGGPFAAGDKAYILDLRDVPGDTFRVKLTPPVAFWQINYIAVDYSENTPVKITETAAVKAADSRGQDALAALEKTDNNYLVMPNTGDSAELIFSAPSSIPGMARTVILKAGGYYDIHLAAKGQPQQETLDRIHAEPGFVLQYAFKEYLKWQKENFEPMENK